MRQDVAYILIDKAGLPSAEAKAGLVLEQALLHAGDDWTYAVTEDGVHWTEVTGGEQWTNLFEILNRRRDYCQTEGRCGSISVEDWDAGTYRVEVVLIEDHTAILPQPGSGIQPPHVGADLPTRAGRMLKKPIFWLGLGAVVVVGYGAYWLWRKG